MHPAPWFPFRATVFGPQLLGSLLGFGLPGAERQFLEPAAVHDRVALVAQVLEVDIVGGSTRWETSRPRFCIQAKSVPLVASFLKSTSRLS